MDVKLDKLIEKLKKEGVDGAQKAADAILEKAKKEASAIKAKAEQEAKDVKSKAEKDTTNFQKNSERAIKQAGRDAELKLKEQITALFDRVFKNEIAAALEEDFLQKLILAVVGNWSEKEELEIKLSEKDYKGLEKVLLAGLKKETKQTIFLQPTRNVEHGFRIGLKGKDLYYDFSDESIALLLKSFLNKRLNQILE